MSQRWANLSLMVVLSNCCFNVVATGNFKRFFNSSDSISPSAPSILPQPLVLGITGQSTGFPSTSTPPSSAKETKSLLPTSSHLKNDSVNVPSPLTSIFIPTSLPLSSITSPATFSSSSSTASTSFGVSAPDSDDGYVIFTPPTFNKPAPTNNETRPCITPNPSVGNIVFIIMPNTRTITLGSNTTYSPMPEFTPPVYCQNQTTNISSILVTSSYYAGSPKIYTGKTTPKETEPQTISPVPLYSSGPHNTYLVPPTTVIITSKNPVVVYTSNTPPSYPSTPKTAYISKVPVDPQGILSQQKAPPSFPVSPTKDSPHVTVPTGGDTNPAQPNNGGGNGNTSPDVQSQPGGNLGEPGGSGGSPGTFLAIPSAGAGSTGSGNGNSDSESSSNGGSFGGGGASESNSGNDVGGEGPTGGATGEQGNGGGVNEGANGVGGNDGGNDVGGLAFSGTTLVPLPPEPTNILVLGGQPITVENSVAYIGRSTFTYGVGSATKTDVFNGETILIGPSGVSLAKTTLAAGSGSGPQLGIAGGLTLTEVGATLGVVSGTTFTVGPGATSTVAVINGETISAGPSAIIGAGTTLAYPLINPTHAVTVEGITFTEIGPTLAVLDGTTFTFGPGAAPTSYIKNSQTIEVGEEGIGFASTTFTGIPQAPKIQAITAGGITFSEIGSTLAVIDGTTFNFGSRANPTSIVVNGQSISIGPGGIGFASTTFTGLAQTPTTQAVTAGGITFSEVGSTLAVIDGTTFTFGPGAQPTSHTFNGQTISIGPQGIGFATTTFTGATNTKSSSLTSTSALETGQGEDNGVCIMTPAFGILGACFLIGAGFIL